MSAAEYGNLPFKEQIDFFRQKVSLPTRAWTDIWEGEHARAFVIAGAMKDELLTDFRTAVDKVIADGVTLEQFRKDFDAIVSKHGWSYNGSPGWRSRVIYDTNLRTSYQAGRYEQMKQVAEDRPFWIYRHSEAVQDPRPEHLAWNGLTLRHDDPWWRTHFPPNGWGCQCYVDTASDADLQRMGKDGPDQAPEIEYRDVTVGSKGPSPRSVRVPQGIDPGFAYNVGEAAIGVTLPEAVMAGWRSASADAWEVLTQGSFATLGLPDRIPMVATPAPLGPRVAAADMVGRVRDVIGGDEHVYRVPGGLSWNVNAAVLADHLKADPGRSPYLTLLPHVLRNPGEVWLTFERHRGTGKVELRARAISRFEVEEGRFVIVVAQGIRGQLEAWTIVPTSDAKYVNKQRVGALLYRDR